MTKPTVLELLGKLHAIELELWEHHNIRHEGAYAEILVAAALGASRNTNGVHRGSDLVHPEFKRIEVRSRRKSLDNRDETRISLEAKKRTHFEHCVHVVFNSNYTVRGAYLAPHDEIYGYLDAGRRHISFNEGLKLPSSRDITAEVASAQHKA
jgi:hypothetical protein